jgi:hypothetical protein
MVVIGNDGKEKIAYVDNCIYGLVKCLNDAGFLTKASCCGHGKDIGIISLQDGRELIIAKDYETGMNLINLLNNRKKDER